MADFLDNARSLFAADPASTCTSDLKRVFGAISALQSVHSKSEMDLVNLESVFSAFEMAELLKVHPTEPELVNSLKRVITWTLDKSIGFEIKEGKFFSSFPYQDFASFIAKLSNVKNLDCSDHVQL